MSECLGGCKRLHELANNKNGGCICDGRREKNPGVYYEESAHNKVPEEGDHMDGETFWTLRFPSVSASLC